ncbi:MAG: Holliday junction resolvase RuvX [Candidatus Competibacteraceae bacterium]|nr:MAG: Holliday junction resolvase RuvX [Candidatus Competibacteraceae bacterium]
MPATPDPPSSTTRQSPQVVLGFDFGRTRIGVATGVVVTGTARPLRVLSTRRQRPDWDAIDRLLAEWRPDLLVVGVPRHADGSANAMTVAALRFSRQLHGRFRLPVATIDERLSSWEAEQRSFEPAAGRRRGDGAALDDWAAALILESWFNQQRSLASCMTPNS